MNKSKIATFRFYEELNDFLLPSRKKVTFTYEFNGKPTVKDAIEACGVPHTEIDVILINGKSSSFSHHLNDGDRVAIYPEFESFDISPIQRLRPKPLRNSKFVLDDHLEKLARNLRMSGFNCLHDKNISDEEIIEKSLKDKRIILTRDRNLLKNGKVQRGYWIRSPDPDIQLREVLIRFDLFSQIKPFIRCMDCNGKLVAVEKLRIKDLLPEKTYHIYNDFKRCPDCLKIYWPGSHYKKMERKIEALRKANLNNS